MRSVLVTSAFISNNDGVLERDCIQNARRQYTRKEMVGEREKYRNTVKRGIVSEF